MKDWSSFWGPIARAGAKRPWAERRVGFGGLGDGAFETMSAAGAARARWLGAAIIGVGVILSGTFSKTEQEALVPPRETARDSESAAPAAAGAPRYSRRLSDKILIAFHHACDQSDFEIADNLLRLLEIMLTRRPVTPDGSRRRSMESLVAAHERLWHLRHHSDDRS